jgi:hypothetical protein
MLATYATNSCYASVRQSRPCEAALYMPPLPRKPGIGATSSTTSNFCWRMTWRSELVEDCHLSACDGTRDRQLPGGFADVQRGHSATSINAKTPIVMTGAELARGWQVDVLRVVAISHAVLARHHAGATAGLHGLSWWAKVRPLRRAVSRVHATHSILRWAHGPVVDPHPRLAVGLAVGPAVLLKTGLAVATRRPAVGVSKALSRG